MCKVGSLALSTWCFVDVKVRAVGSVFTESIVYWSFKDLGACSHLRAMRAVILVERGESILVAAVLTPVAGILSSRGPVLVHIAPSWCSKKHFYAEEERTSS